MRAASTRPARLDQPDTRRGTVSEPTGRWLGSRVSARMRYCGRAGGVMAPKQPTTDDSNGKRKTRRTGTDVLASTTPQQPNHERRFVDIDPWAVLLEGLMATPEEGPAERKPTKGK